MMSMEEGSKRLPFFSLPDDEEYYEEQLPEKKRCLTSEQVHLLEKSFEEENKLEPERKTQLAKKLGLQPRQVAVWFQNRRARWKTKQLERDYNVLKASYDSLLSTYDSIMKENEKLKSEARIYDVFLSFRGEDNHAKFTSHLYTSLQNAGIHVFRDDDIPRGDHISVSLLQAIEKSRICIVVFSRNYANSRWCMLELETIMENHRRKDTVVVPVFYEVDPSEVRDQRGVFGEAFKDLIRRISVDEYKVENWKTALRVVASIAGFVAGNSRNESEDIEEVVEHVAHLLHKRVLFVADNPVGVESRVQYMIQLLNHRDSKDPFLLGIWGMGGIGKTTLAKAIYDQIPGYFEGKSFLLNVREDWAQSNGQVSLQEQLLFDICKMKTKISTVNSGKMMLKQGLQHRRILLIVDNVNKLEQLHALCGSREWFGSGSTIIITTRDRHLLRELGVDHVHRVPELDQSESLELFSWHAFMQASPEEDFVELSREFVTYSAGLPLALKVLGSFLFEKVTSDWENLLQRLKRSPNPEVQKTLKISFDDLDDKEKRMFLDIAHFLDGMNLNDVIHGSKAYSAELGSDLEDKSLVTIDKSKKLRMHVLLRAMGREITREESTGMAKATMYDVFVSYRGEDGGSKFISHLYKSLKSASIEFFKDDKIQRGDLISVSLLKAIGGSRICVVVLSRNYANSRWCMLELESIMENSRTMGLIVVPVFYEVDPSEVRNQTGMFGEAFKDLIRRISVDEYKVENWRTALREVCNMAGFTVLNSRNESDDIEKIVECVTHLLDKTDLDVAKHPVGLEWRVQDVTQLLNNQQSKDPVLLGIWGMGGIGKTTIAKAVYNQIRHDFEAKSFLWHVREVCKEHNGRVILQQKLLSDIYKTTKIKIDTVDSGIKILKEKLKPKRLFLVLDDVNKSDQMEALCGSREWFGQGSRIIITTRNEYILRKLQVDYVYRIKEMDDNESLQLFSWHAFKQPSPGEGFDQLSTEVVKYSGGLPLALQVIGSFLFAMTSKREWNSVLEKLKIIPNDEVMEKLKISFDGLSDDDVKEIFLHIAFFFIGMDRDEVIEILNECKHFAETGISVLVQQSLVTVDRKNKIGMHDLLRDMARAIVRNRSSEGGKEPSRIWRCEDVRDVLAKATRNVDVVGLTLKFPTMNGTTYNLETEAFEKMDKLRLLQLAGVQLDGDFKYLSKDLRWLYWHGFPAKYTATNFHQGSLIAIDLKYSNLNRVWLKSQLMEKLKILNLSHSRKLRQTPDFSNLPNLEKLILKDCPSLSQVSPTIGQLKKILLINLKDCTGLHDLPGSIYKLESLKTLILSGCTEIDKLDEDIEQMKSLTTLIADKTAITRVPFGVVRSKSIGYISLCGFEGFSLNVIPSIIWSWMSPKNNILSQVQTYAMGVSSLDFLDEQNSTFYGLSSILKELQNVQRLWLKCNSSEAQLHIVKSILQAMPGTSQVSNVNTSASIDCRSQVSISGSKNLWTSLLIQLGMNCHVTDILRANILQESSTISGLGLLPGDKSPHWLTFIGDGSSVTFKVPQVDGHNLKTIMCVVYSSSLDNVTSEDLKIVLLINCTMNTIQLYKKDALAFFEDKEWQKVVSHIEPGNEVEIVVVFGNRFVVKKTTIYLIYDEVIQEKTEHSHELDKGICPSYGDENKGDPKKKEKGILHHSSNLDPPNTDEENELEIQYLNTGSHVGVDNDSADDDIHEVEHTMHSGRETFRSNEIGEKLVTWAEAFEAKAERYRGTSMKATSSVAMSDHSITKCVTTLEEIEDISDDIYMKALEKFREPDWREMFLAMSNDRRRAWLFRL